jgi:hypothetical protein
LPETNSMKKWLIFLLAFNTALLTVAQSKKAAIFLARQNILYLGVDNPIRVALETTRSKNIYLTINNGLISKIDVSNYTVVPNHLGPATIRIFELKKGDTLLRDSLEFRAKLLPSPMPMIAGKESGVIKKSQLKSMGGIVARLLNSDYDAYFQVVSYHFIIMRDTGFQKLVVNNGPRYNDVVKQLIEELQVNDHILITNIICKGPDLIERMVQPMEFIIEKE